MSNPSNYNKIKHYAEISDNCPKTITIGTIGPMNCAWVHKWCMGPWIVYGLNDVMGSVVFAPS